MFRYVRHVLAALSLLLVVLVPQSLARAGATELTESEAVALLRSYDIVRGDASGNMRLNEKLTRAQAATLFVRVQGKDGFAYTLANDVPFADARGHWAAGDIAMADRLGLMRGDGNGVFRPDSEITYAEVLTVLLRILGREPQGRWSPEAVRTQAAQFSLVPGGIEVTDPALRGKMFWSLAVAISSVPLPSGETILQKYFDNVPPELKLERTSFSTTEESFAVTGTTVGAVAVTVDGHPATLDNAGRFRYVASLSLGESTFKVEAVDAAGNRVEQTVTGERRIAYARIEINGPKMLRAGTSTKLEIKAYDSKGNVVPTDGMKATLTGNVATFSAETASLVAGNKSGQGVLTLTIDKVSKTFTFDVTKQSDQVTGLSFLQVVNGAPISEGKEFTVRVGAVDASGKVVADDYWRTITLTAQGGGGVMISQAAPTTEAGVVTFKVTALTKGDVTLAASSNGLRTTYSSVRILTPMRVVLSAVSGQLVPDGLSSTAIRATLQDENGRPVANSSGQDIRISLWQGDALGQFTDGSLTIRAGASSSSGDEGAFKAGIRSGSTSIQGTLASAHTYSVMPFTLSVNGKLRGARLQVIGPTRTQRPSLDEAQITVKVLDDQGQLVTTGSYAFQLTVTTSNGGTNINGLPDGLELNFNNDYYPVDDGRSTDDPQNNPYSVVGRTYQGTATVYVRYAKSGVVTITPSLIAGSDNAYHPSTGFGPAAATASMSVTSAQVTFAGTAARIKLTADSTLGSGQNQGATGPYSTSMTIRAQVVDASGTVVPGYTGAITLTRRATGDKVTRISGTTPESLRKTVTSSGTEWSILSNGTSGYDIYDATGTNLAGASIAVAVRDTPASRPTIVAIRGSKNGDTSPELGFIGPDDDFMDIQLARQEPPTGEPSYWVTARVYRVGEGTPVYTGPVDLSADVPIIRVPRANLTVGTASYEVTVHNGVRESARSIDPGFGLNTASVTQYETSYQLTGGLFDRSNNRLTLVTSGLSSNGTIDLQKLSVVRGAKRVNLSTLGTSVVSIDSSSVILQSTGLAARLASDTDFWGALVIEAEAGWYADANRSHVASRTVSAALKPSAVITQATFDEANSRLYLYGEGFTQGSLSLNLIQVGTYTLRQGSDSDYDYTTSVTDTVVTIRLSPTTLNAIRALSGTSLTVTAASGWLTTSYNGTTYAAAAVSGRPVYVRALLSSASYSPERNELTVWGAGLANAVIDLQKLKFRRAGSQTDYRLDASARVTPVDSGTFKIQLSDTDAAYFESTANFAGKTVFLNTDAGWMTDGASRPAIPVPTDSVMFTVPAP